MIDYFYVTEKLIEATYVALFINFLLISVFSKKYRCHAVVILLSAFLYLFFPYEFLNSYGSDNYYYEYIGNIENSVIIDGCIGLALSTLVIIDRLAARQTVLMAFAVMVHLMLLYSLENDGNSYLNSFISYYDEIIIILNMLQIRLSKDGTIDAIRRVQDIFIWTFASGSNVSKGLSGRKKKKA